MLFTLWLLLLLVLFPLVKLSMDDRRIINFVAAAAADIPIDPIGFAAVIVAGVGVDVIAVQSFVVWFRSKQIFRPAQNRSNDNMPLIGVTRRKQSITPCGKPFEPSSCHRASMSDNRTNPLRLSSIISNNVRMLETNFFGRFSNGPPLVVLPLPLPPPPTLPLLPPLPLPQFVLAFELKLLRVPPPLPPNPFPLRHNACVDIDGTLKCGMVSFNSVWWWVWWWWWCWWWPFTAFTAGTYFVAVFRFIFIFVSVSFFVCSFQFGFGFSTVSVLLVINVLNLINHDWSHRRTVWSRRFLGQR